jgi:uncharacterized membrane protein
MDLRRQERHVTGNAPTSDDVPAGLTVERLGFFTDAVFAIAMTLLVIEIPRPEDGTFDVGDGVSKSEAAHALGRFLGDQASSFGAYILAFFMLWIVWRQHHTLLDRLGRLSPALLGWHLPLLLLAGFLPYPTTVFGHYASNPLAALFYGVIVGALLVCRSAVQTVARRDELLLPHVDVAHYRLAATVSWGVAVYWMLTLVGVWWTPWLTIFWFLTPVIAPAVERPLRSRYLKAAG